ncbi:unnamed protein product [Choristocarpus tenellus]
MSKTIRRILNIWSRFDHLSKSIYLGRTFGHPFLHSLTANDGCRVRPQRYASEEGWQHAGRKGGRRQFWPWPGDLNILAAEVRAAVLLDCRQVPSDFPPLPDVLLALQEDHECGGEHIGAIGVLIVEDTVFLVNRRILQSRLLEIIPGDLVDRLLEGNPVDLSNTVVQNRKSNSLPGVALVSVGHELKSPLICSGPILPFLSDALRWAFFREGTNICQKVETSGEGEVAAALLVFGKGSWLRDWSQVELRLDGGTLIEKLGNVGLSGFAGWLLEYPVVYCCASVNMYERDLLGCGEGSEKGKNCLSYVPLRVYTVRFDAYPPSSNSHNTARNMEHSFSFSIPEVAESDKLIGRDIEGGMDDETKSPAFLRGLATGFLTDLKARVGQRYASVFRGLVVHDRVETLSHVAI